MRMDEYIGFEFLLLDASASPQKPVAIIERGPRREAVDVVARQFHRFLTRGTASPTEARGIMLTSDFKLRGEAADGAGWLTFIVDESTGSQEVPRDVATVVFARADDAAGRAALRRLEGWIAPAALPAAPCVVAVKLAPKVPSIIREWWSKCAAGFFAGQ
jgi:hypothetical protein